MSRKNWSSKEIAYLEAHSSEGVEAIAKALNRSENAVMLQAKRYGISLRKRWICPNCGATVYRPLSARTGWCSNCTKEERNRAMARDVAAMEEEARREEALNRERLRLYKRKSRVQKKLGGEVKPPSQEY